MQGKEFSFELITQDDKARLGKIHTSRCVINTPAFMPVGTQGTVKGIFADDILKTNTQNQLMELTSPDEWDGIDYSFLNSNDFSIYEKCDSIPGVYQIIYGEIVSLMNSKLIETCNVETNPQECITETFNFLDVSNNKELSVAELTRAARILIYFTFIDKRVGEDRDIGFATYTTTSLFFPAISKILIGNYDYDNSNTLSLSEIYTDRVASLDYQNLFKDNIKGLDPAELRKLIENLDFLKSILIN